MRLLKNIGKWLGAFGLFVLAFVLYVILFIPLLIASTIICIIRSVRRLEIEPLAKYYLENATAVDEGGNVHGGPVWNVIFFYPWSNPKLKFGSRKQTMSMVFGVNMEGSVWQAIRLYTPLALAIIVFVEICDRGHMARAAQNYKNERTSIPT